MRPGAIPLPMMTSLSVMKLESRVSRRGLFSISFRDHHAGKSAIRRKPSFLGFRREIRPKAFLQRPDESLADRRVMGRRHAVADMLDGESSGGREDGVEVLEAIHHDAKRRHQLSSLLVHIAAEERFRLRRYFEKTTVKKRRGRIGDRRDLGEGCLNKIDLLGRHDLPPSSKSSSSRVTEKIRCAPRRPRGRSMLRATDA